jgi:hypothetical protein
VIEAQVSTHLPKYHDITFQKSVILIFTATGTSYLTQIGFLAGTCPVRNITTDKVVAVRYDSLQSPISWRVPFLASWDPLGRTIHTYTLARGHLGPDANRLTDECLGNTLACVTALMPLLVNPRE